MELLLQGYPCPGCWEPITHEEGEFHHALFREGDAFTEEQKAFLYDARNGTLVHHNCHQREGLQFRLNCAVMITQRSGGKNGIIEYIEDVGALFRGMEKPEIPELWGVLLRDWDEGSWELCPACQENRLHSYITGRVWLPHEIGSSKVICWNCLWRNW